MTIKNEPNLTPQDFYDAWQNGWEDEFKTVLKNTKPKKTLNFIISKSLEEYSRSTASILTRELKKTDFFKKSVNLQLDIIAIFMGLDKSVGVMELNRLILDFLLKNSYAVDKILSETRVVKSITKNNPNKFCGDDLILLWNDGWSIKFEERFLTNSESFIDALSNSALDIKEVNPGFKKILDIFLSEKVKNKDGFLNKICTLVGFKSINQKKLMEYLYGNKSNKQSVVKKIEENQSNNRFSFSILK